MLARVPSYPKLLINTRSVHTALAREGGVEAALRGDRRAENQDLDDVPYIRSLFLLPAAPGASAAALLRTVRPSKYA